MSAVLKRLLAPFREFGWFAGFVYLVDRFLSSVSTRCRLQFYEFMVQPVADKPLLTPALARQLEFREILQGAPELDLMPARKEIKESRYAQDAVCLGVFKRTQFVGFIWFCFGRYEEDEVRCNFDLIPQAASAFDFDLFLFPSQRMGLGFAAVWNCANAYLWSKGINYTYSRVAKFNLASRRAHARLGAQLVGQALFFQLGILELMIGTLSPFLHLSIGPCKRVHLTLRPNRLRG